jgi:AsmA protein
LGGINLSNGEITLDDALNDQRLRAEQVNITLSALRLGQPSKLRAEALWVTAQQTQQAELRATITPNKNRSLAIRDTQLRLGDVAVDQLDADLKLTAQGLRVEPLSARFFDGDYQGDIQLITADATMPARFDESLTGVAIGPLLAALTDIESLTGRGNVSLSGQINLAGAETALASLNGQGRLSIRDGAINGVNIARTLRAAAARLEGRQPPAASGPAQTDFTTLNASVVITNGIARTDDLALDSPLLRLRGRGQTNLDTQTLDLALEVNWVDTLEGQDGKALEALQGITIPARMTGRWSDPSIEIDVAEAIRQNQSKQLRERINQEVDSLRERLEGLFD